MRTAIDAVCARHSLQRSDIQAHSNVLGFDIGMNDADAAHVQQVRAAPTLIFGVNCVSCLNGSVIKDANCTACQQVIQVLNTSSENLSFQHLTSPMQMMQDMADDEGWAVSYNNELRVLYKHTRSEPLLSILSEVAQRCIHSAHFWLLLTQAIIWNILRAQTCDCLADSKVHSVKLEAEFEAPLWHVMALMVEFDLTKTWNAFMQVCALSLFSHQLLFQILLLC